MRELERIFNIIERIASRSWSHLSKIVAVAALIITGYIGYKMLFSGLVIYDSTKMVVIADSTVDKVKEVSDKLLGYENIVGVSTYIYQPDNLPKKSLQLLTSSVDTKNTYTAKYPVFTEVGETKPLDMSIYSQLQYAELVVIDGSGKTFIDYIVRYEEGIGTILIYGLYRYATPAGSVVIIFDETSNAEGEIEAIYNAVRYIDSLLYRE